MGKSWNIPRFDVYDPSLVFYAPLWRPDMVARGGAIKNGTGTMNVSPQALAVGANTITVTAAGTLIVNMPEGGTVASGTMTVTGSPVTVSAGIATTITTTGATGNITATPSNIIRSKDKSNHALTITGATWGYQGRTFDGSDDQISAGDNAAFTFGNSLVDSPFSVFGWQKPDSTDPGATITKYGDGWVMGREWQFTPSGGTNQLMLLTADNSAQVTPYRLADVAYSPLDTWHFFGGTYDGTGGATAANGMILYTDGAVVASTATNNASYVAMEDTTQALRIGVASTSFGKGIIGDVWLYNRVLSAAEIQRIYQVSKWRYL